MQVVDELRRMSDERFQALYETLAQNGFGPLDGEVAKALKFRPQAIRKLPIAQRAKRARALLLRANNAELAYELFGSYLMKTCKELITDFLDATGVEHEDGMIHSVEESKPAADKIGTDPQLAFGVARGTGLYRPAPLVRVADAAPYLHGGELATLEALLSTARLKPEFVDGVRGPGAVPGHRYGTGLAEDDRYALIAYLGTL